MHRTQFEIFSLLQNVQNRSETHSASYPMVTRAQILTSRLKVDYRSHILTSRLKADYWGPNRDLSPQGGLLGPKSWPLDLRQITRTRILTSRLKADYRAQILTSPLKADYWGPNRDLSPQGRLVELCLHGALCLLCMQKCNLTCILLCCTRFRNPEGMRRFRSDVKMKLKETGPTL